MAMFALTCWLLTNGRHRWLPLVFVVWTNLHAGVVLGLAAVFAALAVQIAVERRVRWSRVASAVGCAAATLISPLGPELWSFLPAAFERARDNQLVEWMPPGASPALWPFWMLVIALPIAAIVGRRRLDERAWTLAAIAMTMLPLAVRSMRNIGFFLVVGVPALSVILTAKISGRRNAVPAEEHERLNAVLLLASVLIALVLAIRAWSTPAARLGWRPMSEEAAAAIARCDGPIYNTYADGGILIWFVPTKRVFIDSRQDQYPAELLEANRAAEFTGNYRMLFDTHHVNCAVVPPASPIAARLGGDPEWRLAYSDGERWSVFDARAK
jgi:hypothetical protein